MSRASGWTKTLTVILAAALSGCQPNDEQALLDDYLTRLARITEGSVRLAEPETLPAYPPRRSLELDVPRRTIDVAEFIDLHRCDMGALVGLRNSPLGRVQGASQRLGYEAAWLAAAEVCGDDAAEWLAALGAVKREGLPANFWNATFAASEMRTALGGAAAPAGGDLADILRGLNDSFTLMLDGGFDAGGFEALLGRLQQGSWAGPARRDWSRWRRQLDGAAALLAGAVPEICLNRQPTPRVRRLQNVFRAFYVEQIQPRLARNLREHEAWIMALQHLVQRVDAVSPEAFAVWFDQVLSPDNANSEWRRTQQAVVDHARAWQRVFTHCGIDPISGLGQD